MRYVKAKGISLAIASFALVACSAVQVDEQASEVSEPAPRASALEAPRASQIPGNSGSESVSPMPTGSATSGENLDAPASGEAESAVTQLRVKGRAPQTGYSREQFGPAWVDVDRNGCDTRNDMLGRDLSKREMSGSCKVLAGTLADPYTRTAIRFVYGGASEVDVDHVVALSDAWQKGASSWAYAKRVAVANDPLNLQPTDASANRQKGDGDAATWLPPNRGYRCQYVARQAAVKKKYDLWVTSAEQSAMLRVLADCPGQQLPGPGSQPTIASNTGGQAPANADAGGSTRPPGNSGTVDPRFGTCAEAISAGYGPYYRGQDSEYPWYIDRDSDGIVCE